ncbi:MAG TPA: tellurite resistance TerB family protein [Rhodobacteraceae bacterium]|nr:tellurite resistance TerB family protein [Paracoccaceae bacterium]
MASGQRSAQPAGRSTQPGGGLGSIFGDKYSPRQPGGSGGGLPDLGGLGQILAGRGGGQGGGLGGLLEGLSQASRPKGNIEVATPKGGSLGDLLNQSLERFGEPEAAPEPEHEEAAKVMLRAMLQAAKSDGRIDAKEKDKLLGQLGDISDEDMAFINEELAKPVDVRALARDVPFGMAEQVYTMALLAIDLDNRKEAEYLNDLAGALGIDHADANAIHEKMGEPKLYA